jgi:hypothetical protein
MCDISREKICELGRCLKSVRGVVATGVSPTDMWIIEFADKSRYGKQMLEKGMMKVFTHSPIENQALEYERNVYRLTRWLMHYKMCPNFLFYLSGGTCTLNQIERMFMNVGLTRKNVVRSMNYMLQKLARHHPVTKSLHEPLGSSPKATPSNTEIDVILTKYTQNTKSFNDVFRESSTRVIWGLMFQVTAGIYTMYLSGISHNDLHGDNVLIVPKGESLCYNINGVYYTISAAFPSKALIFDYDRGFSKQLGPNRYLDREFCTEYNQCNKVRGTSDFIRFFMNMATIALSNKKYSSILNLTIIQNIIAKTQKGRNTLKQIYDSPTRNWLNKTVGGRYVCFSDKELSEGMNSPEEILGKVAEKSSSYPGVLTYGGVRPNILLNDIWTVKREYFSTKGIVNVNRVNSDLDNLCTERLLQFCSTKNPTKKMADILAPTLPLKYSKPISERKDLTKHGVMLSRSL